MNIFVDGMNISYRFFHKLKTRTKAGKPSGLFYGVLDKAVSLLLRYSKARVSFLWEGSGINIRRHLLSTYKMNRAGSLHRTAAGNVFQENLAAVRKGLSLFGVHQYDYPTLEADDLADYFVKTAGGGVVLLVSNDEDWFGLARNGVSLETGEGTLSVERIRERLGYDPSKVSLFKAVRGCRSDNVVPAVRGIRTADLVQIVEKCQGLDDLVAYFQETGLSFVDEGKLRVNHSVVQLYGDVVVDDPVLLNHVEPEDDPKERLRLLQEWECASLIAKLELLK